MMLAQAGFLVFVLGTASVLATPCTDQIKMCRTSTQAKYPSNRCKFFSEFIDCVRASEKEPRKVCRLEKTRGGADFDTIKKTAEKECPVFSPLLDGVVCSQLQTCLDINTNYSILTGTDTFIADAIHGSFWCKLMKSMISCAITNAPVCNHENRRDALENAECLVRGICAGADSLHKETLTTVLALLAVAVLQKLMST